MSAPTRTGDNGPTPPELQDDAPRSDEAGATGDADIAAENTPRPRTGHARRGRLESFLRTSHRSFRGRTPK